jgi:hypothetical protein
MKIYRTLVHFLPENILELQAEDETQKFLRNNEQWISYDNFKEFFASFAFRWVENVNLSSAIGFIN